MGSVQRNGHATATEVASDGATNKGHDDRFGWPLDRRTRTGSRVAVGSDQFDAGELGWIKDHIASAARRR